MIRISVCDDNVAMLHKLVTIVTETFDSFDSEFRVLHFNNGAVMLNEHKRDPFDIIFLDIDMPKLNGFEVAKALRDEFSHCFIIFVTSHAELVYESMDFQPFHFIRKNCSISLENSVSNVAKKLMKHMKQNDKVILEDNISGRCAVYIRDIIYIESDKHYVYYNIAKKELPIKMRSTMKECEKAYNRYDFVRIHKKYLINLKYLGKFNSKDDEVLLKSINKKLPMSKNLKGNVDEKYTIYLRSTI